MSLDGFCWTLFAVASGGQLLGAAAWWLMKRAPGAVKATFGALAELPPALPNALMVLGACAGIMWGVAASDAGAFPAPWIDELQRTLVGSCDPDITKWLLGTLALPIYPFIVLVHSRSAPMRPRRRLQRKARRATKRTQKSAQPTAQTLD